MKDEVYLTQSNHNPITNSPRKSWGEVCRGFSAEAADGTTVRYNTDEPVNWNKMVTHAVIGPAEYVSIHVDHRRNVDVQVLQHLLQLLVGFVWIHNLNKHSHVSLLALVNVCNVDVMSQCTNLFDEPLAEGRSDPLPSMDATVHPYDLLLFDVWVVESQLQTQHDTVC